MPRWAIFLIIGLVLCVLLVVGVIAAGAYWLARNKDSLLARGKAQIEEGREAGRQTDNQGCVDRSVSRYKTQPGFTGAIATNLFMESCLMVSKATPGFCDAVPAPTEFIKSAEWRLAQCRRVDLANDQLCQQLFSSVQNFCERRLISPEPSPTAEYSR